MSKTDPFVDLCRSERPAQITNGAARDPVHDAHGPRTPGIDDERMPPFREHPNEGVEICTFFVIDQRQGSIGQQLRVWHPQGQSLVELNVDISAQVGLEQKNALLAGELEHRLKNILGVIQGLTRLSLANVPEEQRRPLDQRIVALSDANRVLYEGAWKQADLRTIVMEVAGRLGLARRIDCAGPDMAVSSDDAMGFALVVHELCTNALKYGALSRATGRVGVTWSADGAESKLIRLRWRERGGAPVATPNRTGFGMRLIRSALTAASNARTQVDFDKEGLIVEMTMRAAETT